MVSRLWFFLVLICFPSTVLGAAEKRFTIKYISSEYVYLDGGRADSLEIGGRLEIIAGKDTTVLEVVFVAEHSASCAIVNSSAGYRIGDQAVMIEKELLAAIPVEAPVKEARPAPTQSPSSVQQRAAIPPSAHVNGNFAVGFYQWQDQSDGNLDFTQSTARFNLRARRLWGKELNLNIRTRGRYDQRQRSISTDVPRNDWENRLWEMSLSYEEPESPVNLMVGRFVPRRASGIGYIDGMLLESRLSGKWRLGAVGGAQPKWLYAEDRMSLLKGGTYLQYQTGQFGSNYFEQGVAAIGEYYKQEVSREYVSWQGRFSFSRRWGVSHQAEFDINRSWRKEKVGQTISLSNIYLNGFYNLNPRVRVNLRYDNRKNYWIYETRTLVDSVFDDHLRQGFRGQLDLTLPAQLAVSSGFGFRGRSGDSGQTYSYSVSVNKGGLIFSGANVLLYFSGFSGPFENGYNYSIRLGQYTARGGYISLAYGSYLYAGANAAHRVNRWVEAAANVDILPPCYLGAQVQHNSGDDIKGIRLQLELGYRF